MGLRSVSASKDAETNLKPLIIFWGSPSSGTPMLTLHRPIYRKLGFSWGTRLNRQERAWLQFTDDAAIVASDDACTQGLFNPGNGPA